MGGPRVQPGRPDRFARRCQLKVAVFGPHGLRSPGPGQPGAGQLDAGQLGAAGRGQPLLRVVTGQVLDASPQVLVIGTSEGEERFALAADARAWRGERTAPAAIRAGDQAVVRRHRSGREVADRIWANIGRVTGTIVQRHGRTLLVAQGGGHQAVMIGKRAAGRIQVRFPRLEPGYLVDLIGIRRDGYLEGLVPATSQPTYRADHVPTPPLVNGHVPTAISGAAMWHEPGDEPDGLTGAAYPAIDPQNAADAGAAGSGCVSLPYLSVGSVLRVRNDCTGLSRVLPVLGPADTARQFCDRSVSCGPSPRGRIVDLTVTSFAELGGELDEGNVNVTIEIGA
jgi:hypothetical protein